MDRSRYEKIYAGEAKTDEMLKFEHNPGQMMMMSMIRAADNASREKEGGVIIGLHVMISGLMHFFSIFIQIGVLFLVYAYPVEESEDPWESHVGRETQALRSALGEVPPRKLILEDPWERRAEKLCANEHTILFSQSLLIFTWVTKMLPYLWKTGWTFYVTTRLPSADGQNPLCYEADDKAIVITHMRRGVLIAIVALVLMPQLVLDLLILYVGSKFLFFCPDLLTLITKSMCFFFLTQLDDVIYEGLGSRAFKEVISKSTFRWHKVPNPHWDLWGSSALKTALAISVTLYYTRVFHGDVQTFRQLCWEYKATFPHCESCGLDLFGMHWMPA